MGTKIAVAVANQIFMGKSLAKAHSNFSFGNDISNLDGNRKVLSKFIDQENNHHSTIKFTAESSDTKNYCPGHQRLERRKIHL